LLRVLDEDGGALSVICGWSPESSAHERVIKILTVASVASVASLETMDLTIMVSSYVLVARVKNADEDNLS
jgi:hypothetical protein